MDIKFGYETYQDVRKNLFYYSIPILNIAGFYLFFSIIPPKHQTFITSLIDYLSTFTILKPIIGVALFSGASMLLTETFQVHDRWYDRFIIKWRFRYATDFILPRLIHPFASKIDYRFHAEAGNHIKEFQESLYYPFVGDRDGKIGKNLLVKFYERITIYWLTQIIEIVSLLLFIIAMSYYLFYPLEPPYIHTLANSFCVLFIVFILNRIWAKISLRSVRDATENEIRAIHENHLDELEAKLRILCKSYSIPYVG
jgi:hypothetical protein